MGYTSAIMSQTIGELATMQTAFGQLVSVLQDDANNMARVTGDLVAHNFQGPKAIELTSMTQNYQTLLHSHAYDRLQQLSQICKSYQQAIESACATFDNNHPQVGNDFADYVFSNGLAYSSIPSDLPKADQDVTNALSGASSAYMQQVESQLTSQHVKLNRSILMDLQDEITSTSDDLHTWATALDTAFTQWQNALNGADAHNVDIPSFTYDNGNGQMVSMTFDTKYEQSLTNAFDQEDPNYGTSSASGIESLNPEDYQKMITIYTDPRTQRALKLLMTTPTGRNFAEYYIYMGEKFGGNFISWDHLGKKVGAVSTDGGFVVLNLDDSTQSEADEIEMSGYLVHEGVESYFDGQGIRQMGTQHADYVAEWFQGKFMQEAGGSDTRAYGMTFQDWLTNGNGTTYKDESPNVVLYTDGSTLDRPGVYWPGNGNWNDFWGSNFNLGTTTVTGIPNPGLDPRMLLSNDLNGPLPKIPPPPPPKPHPYIK
jgi:hypothetical protein